MDELTLLRSTRSELEPPRPTLDRGRAALLTRAASSAASPPAPSPIRRRWVLGVAAVGTAVALTGGALAIAQASRETIEFSARCYETASLAADYTDVGRAAATDIRTGETADRERVDPIADCGAMWRMGLVGQDVAPDDPNAANFPIPQLVACELRDGRGAAFPRQDGSADAAEFCRNLGLAVW